MSSNQAPGTHSSRRVNFLAEKLGSRRYLEIGVFSGSTFLHVDVDRKVAVDPKFQFNTKQHSNPKTTFFEMTSDRYFGEFAEGSFDLIFLDGLHTHQQTFRDFCASFAFAHEATVWLLDDTLPSDVFSAWPEPHRAVEMRKAHGGAGNAWHGDVYKVVFLIESFFPTFNYCTINTGGNPQTLVWKQSRAEFKPRFGDLTSIANLHYFDAMNAQEAFKFREEEDALNYVLSNVRSR